ncbi:hypothetical protein [uncultured Cohaesibacter sp.]|uniref:hypothetical protein n=1 Tax=uncultured Cohaesibacter sp. TaxID=1002546 RepID=UPI002AAB2DE4|nr:hypothetical protein [uncultured Cohaesibacter sp.]
MSDEKIYPVLSAIRRNGILYKPSDPEANKISMTPKEAAQLLKLKVVGEPEEVAPEEAETEAGETEDTGLLADGKAEDSLTDEERKQAIINAFPSLKADSDLTKAGEPKVSVIEKQVGFDVSADEVKAIWAEIQAQNAAVKSDADGKAESE